MSAPKATPESNPSAPESPPERARNTGPLPVGAPGVGAKPGVHILRGTDAPLVEEGDLPPVVARLVVEIRSDGTRTLARGALEDRITGEKVAIVADAKTPLALAQELSSALLKTPALAKETLKAFLPDLGSIPGQLKARFLSRK